MLLAPRFANAKSGVAMGSGIDVGLLNDPFHADANNHGHHNSRLIEKKFQQLMPDVEDV
jgi:hypothetical protein